LFTTDEAGEFLKSPEYRDKYVVSVAGACRSLCRFHFGTDVATSSRSWHTAVTKESVGWNSWWSCPWCWAQVGPSCWFGHSGPS